MVLCPHDDGCSPSPPALFLSSPDPLQVCSLDDLIRRMGALSKAYTQVGTHGSHRPGTVSLAQERLVPQFVSPFTTQTPTGLRTAPREASGGVGGYDWAAAFKLGKLITRILTSSWAPPTACARPCDRSFSWVVLFGPHFTGEETEALRRAVTCLESPGS